MKKLVTFIVIFIVFILSPWARKTPLRELHNSIYSAIDSFHVKKVESEYYSEIPQLSKPAEPEKNPQTVKSLDLMKELSKEEDEKKELDKRKFVK